MHRDLKLANVMLNFNELPKDVVTDGNFNRNEYIKNFDFAQKY